MIELMEMDSLLQIPPPDTFRRLGFGGFSWSGFLLGFIVVVVGGWLIYGRAMGVSTSSTMEMWWVKKLSSYSAFFLLQTEFQIFPDQLSRISL